MSLQFFGHPFSSYCQKVLIALYELGRTFEFKLLAPGEPAGVDFAKRWPLQRMPLLVDHGQSWVESSIIIEHLVLSSEGAPPLIPSDPPAALRVRFLDRIFDNYVMTPMQRIVADFMRPAPQRDTDGTAQAHALLESSYEWLEANLRACVYTDSDAFTLADCAAAPSLFYADWVHPIGERFGRLRALRVSLLERPAVRRVVDEARPYRHLFPPGAPARD